MNVRGTKPGRGRATLSMLLLIACGLSAGACPGTLSPAPPAGNSPPRPNDVEGEAALEEEMLRLVNAERRTEGLPEVEMDPALAAIARLHSHDMIESHFVGHVSPVAGGLSDRLEEAGYLARVARENVALNQSVGAAHRSLMDSPEHRRNILADDVSVAGIGIVRDGPDLLITQVFAEPAGQSEPVLLRSLLLYRINDARVAAELQPLPIHEALQALAAREVRRMNAPLSRSELKRATQAALPLARADDAFSRVSVTTQTVIDARDLRVPRPSLTAEAAVLAVAARRVDGPGGKPVVILLTIIGGE